MMKILASTSICALLISVVACGTALDTETTIKSQVDQTSVLALLAQCDGNDTTLLMPEAQTHAVRSAVFANREWIRWPKAMKSGESDRFRLVYSDTFSLTGSIGTRLSGQTGAFELELGALPEQLNPLVNYLGRDGVSLRLPAAALAAIGDSASLSAQWWIVQETGQQAGQERGQKSGQADGQRSIKALSGLQWARFYDQQFAAATEAEDLGVAIKADGVQFKLWAANASAVSVCLYADSRAPAYAIEALARDPNTAIFSTLSQQAKRGQYYRYLADVPVPGLGKVRNRSTDPYSISLSADSQRSYIGDLNDPNLMPAGWQDEIQARALTAQTEMQIYELHVRDFSLYDPSVRAAWRGKYLAFTDLESQGMQHLGDLAEAGLTDLHLLPVFDLASVPEQGCVQPEVPRAAPDSNAQRKAILAVRGQDCFNWGYDPWHFGALEGSYATQADDGANRIREFRAMVDALHRLGLRVGMDVVYNHTMASGQGSQAVLDRLVPGYYHRLNGEGIVERSTCCDNTATEHRMMAKLMRDTLIRFVRDYRIDSFRFDLVGHQPKDVMVAIKTELDQLAGREIHLIGEGWNFGEVTNNARFVQATQDNLRNTGIATFSDRMRDAARGGGCCDGGLDLVRKQGFLTGLDYDRNDENAELTQRQELLQSGDLIKLGLAGTLQDFLLTDSTGARRPGSQLRYGDLPAGYVAEPSEVVNYVENHDNPTFFDVAALKLPLNTSRQERARVQALGMALVAFSQGVAYYHAGMEMLRSKSFDRNSYDSGDYFNRMDFSFSNNGFGPGLPINDDPVYDALTGVRLADPSIQPTATDLEWTRRMFLSMIKIRATTPMLRLTRAVDITRSVSIHNTGRKQVPTVLAYSVDGSKLTNYVPARLLVLMNVDVVSQTLTIPELSGQWRIHPVQADPNYPDQRVHKIMLGKGGRFSIPARTAVVLVRTL